MTDRDYVIRACEMGGINLLKPTKRCPGILATDWNRKVSGVHPCAIDAQTWKQARGQIDAYFRSVADARR
jgi:hypothetical protein